jgi:hypothetical protein
MFQAARAVDDPSLNTKYSATGLWCLDEAHEDEVRERGFELLQDTSTIRFTDGAGNVSQMVRALDGRVSALLSAT